MEQPSSEDEWKGEDHQGDEDGSLKEGGVHGPSSVEIESVRPEQELEVMGGDGDLADEVVGMIKGREAEIGDVHRVLEVEYAAVLGMRGGEDLERDDGQGEEELPIPSQGVFPGCADDEGIEQQKHDGGSDGAFLGHHAEEDSDEGGGFPPKDGGGGGCLPGLHLETQGEEVEEGGE